MPVHTAVAAAQASAWSRAPLAQRLAWLEALGDVAQARLARSQLSPRALPGPTGERNELRLHARGVVVVMLSDRAGAGIHAADRTPDLGLTAAAQAQGKAALVCGNAIVILAPSQAQRDVARMTAAWHAAGVPQDAMQVVPVTDAATLSAAAAALWAHPDVAVVWVPRAQAAQAAGALAQRTTGPLARLLVDAEHDPMTCLWLLCAEQTYTVNTAAAGGNAALLTQASSAALPLVPRA